MSEPKLGDKSTCKMCGDLIIYVGPYWKHDGIWKPRHPALPKEDKPQSVTNPAPEASEYAWW